MIFKSLDAILIQTFVLSFLSIYLSLKLTKSVANAATAYWGGWIFLELGTYIAERNLWISEIASICYSFISIFHYGAFIGFVLGTITFKQKWLITKRSKLNTLYTDSIRISDLLSDKLLFVLFVVGMFFLAQRIATVGFNLDYFTNVRQIYLEQNFNFLQWIGTHIYMVVMFVIIMIGVRHAFEGMNISALLKIVLAAAPLFLANGTRTFLLAPFIAYFSSFSIARGVIRSGKYLFTKKELRSILISLFSILTIFAMIGFVRGGYGEKLNIFYTVLIWPVSTMTAMESWLTNAIYSTSTNGLLTFDWLANFMHKIGLIDFSREKNIIDSVLFHFESTYNSALVIPRSILPDLIFDFGKRNLFISILLITFILQHITLKFGGSGIFFHVLATQCFIAAFMTIQSSIFSPGFIVVIFWSLVFYILLKVKI